MYTFSGVLETSVKHNFDGQLTNIKLRTSKIIFSNLMSLLAICYIDAYTRSVFHILRSFSSSLKDNYIQSLLFASKTIIFHTIMYV